MVGLLSHIASSSLDGGAAQTARRRPAALAAFARAMIGADPLDRALDRMLEDVITETTRKRRVEEKKKEAEAKAKAAMEPEAKAKAKALKARLEEIMKKGERREEEWKDEVEKRRNFEAKAHAAAKKEAEEKTKKEAKEQAEARGA